MKPLQWLKLNYQQFGTSIFSAMTAAAQKFNAVNLAQGFPNFDGPDEIKNAACAAITGGQNQYAPSAGILELRQKISERQLRKLNVNYNAQDEVTVFSGATEALFCAFQAFFKPNDEILVFEPFFDCYPAGIFSVGAKMIPLRLNLPNWDLNITEIEKKITPQTRGILINTPHNPTGKMFSESELKILAKLARTNDLIILTDEVYDELSYDGRNHLSIATLAPERTVVISSFAKSFSLTGWKVGYACAPKFLTEGLRLAHQYTVFCAATPLQMGLVNAYDLPTSYFENLRKIFTERRDYLINVLTEVGFLTQKPEGGYFIIADFAKLAEKFFELKDFDDMQFAMWLTEKGVACLPTQFFYQEPPARHSLVRFAFCKDMDTLKEAGARLRRIFTEAKKT